MYRVLRMRLRKLSKQEYLILERLTYHAKSVWNNALYAYKNKLLSELNLSHQSKLYRYARGTEAGKMLYSQSVQAIVQQPPGSRILSSFYTLDPFSTTHNVQPITENGTSSHFLWCHLLTLPFSLLFSDTVTTIPKGFAPLLSSSWLNPRRHLFKWFKIKKIGGRKIGY